MQPRSCRVEIRIALTERMTVLNQLPYIVWATIGESCRARH